MGLILSEAEAKPERRWFDHQRLKLEVSKRGVSYRELERMMRESWGEEWALRHKAIGEIVEGRVRDPHLSALVKVCRVLGVGVGEVLL